MKTDQGETNENRSGTWGASMKTLQLAQHVGKGFDLPKRSRWVLFVVFLMGLGMFAWACLISMGNPGKVGIDKVVHFSAYFVLAIILVVSLRPTLYIPGLALLVGFSASIEWLQQFTGRSKDIVDEVANMTGVAVGLGVGLIVRFVYSLIRKELAANSVRRRIQHIPAGGEIFRPGDRLSWFFVVKSGVVEFRETSGEGMPGKAIAWLEPGEMFGVLSVLDGKRQEYFAFAFRDSEIYAIERDELFSVEGEHKDHPAILVIRHLQALIHQRFKTLPSEVAEG